MRFFHFINIVHFSVPAAADENRIQSRIQKWG